MTGTQPEDCPKTPMGQVLTPCAMSEVETGAKLIKTAVQCTRCGWVDPKSLDRWAEHAIKSSLNRTASAVALAVDGRPFTFVQSTEHPLTLANGLAQALGAASACWENLEHAGGFDAARAKEIFDQIYKLVHEFGAHELTTTA